MAGDLSGTNDIARRAIIEWLRGWIGAHRDWSRKRLARELCVLWDWRNGMGRLKDFAARSFLLKLAERELIELPPVREHRRRWGRLAVVLNRRSL